MNSKKIAFLVLCFSSSVSAFENIKVAGAVEFYYSSEARSTDGESSPSIFKKEASYTDLSLNLGLNADISDTVSSGIALTAVSNLGLENNLATGVSSNAHQFNVQDESFSSVMWMSEAWLAYSGRDNTLKIGRQRLDSPLLYTEDWGVDFNSFEAGLLINESIPSTFVVAGWVGKSNGTSDDETSSSPSSSNGQGLANGALVSQDGKFYTLAENGAYMFGIINHSIPDLSLEAWYYNLQGFAQAYWAQSDLDINGFLAGLQYTNIKTDTSSNADEAFALMLGYEDDDLVSMYIAYSKVGDKGDIGVGNFATGGTTLEGRNGSGSETKLYTEMWWNYGAVSQIGSESYSISAEKTAFGIDFFTGYYFSDIKPYGAANNLSVEELTLSATKEFGPLLAEFVLIFDEYNYEDSNPEVDTKALTFQVDLTYSF